MAGSLCPRTLTVSWEHESREGVTKKLGTAKRLVSGRRPAVRSDQGGRWEEKTRFPVWGQPPPTPSPSPCTWKPDPCPQAKVMKPLAFLPTVPGPVSPCPCGLRSQFPMYFSKTEEFDSHDH